MTFTKTGADDFVITRRRKKYRFTRFNELANCFHLDEWEKVHQKYLSNGSVVAEIGAGSALFLVEQAKLFPDKVFVAVDIKSDRLYRGGRAADEADIYNIYFVRSDIARLSEVFPVHSVDELWLTFSDPYPRNSDRRHRLTHERFLKLYEKVLSADGVLHFKTDSDGLFDFSLDSLRQSHWAITEQTRDLHGSDLAENYKVMTSYEERFVSEGLKIKFLSAVPPKK
ncbi:MAG: tRNA (guanosine(46)-N7)-methyltransferase TrmB [Candidatus Nomurabacteria bacterium]|jgi:tRNA (guanine-N7-)-methyltransferase|nr:tRNA (guanosine(46)-N7)-methyltransferase TrmB [Candidatus Nomurabacteria bacterium]